MSRQRERSLFLTVIFASIGGALLALALATKIPALGVSGLLYLLFAAVGGKRRAAPGWRFLRATVLGVFALLGGGLVVLAGGLWLNGDPPVPDAFYDAPATLPTAPGALVRAEPFTRAVPEGARAWRMLYTTTRADGVPALASAVVLAPSSMPAEPLPVVAWTHGTTGIANGCAPTTLPAPYPFDMTVPALWHLVDQRWVLVGTDYIGLGTAGTHPYLIGEPEGRSALDAVRAVRQLRDLTLASGTVVWGFSQGGHAALWTGMIAPSYAPDVQLLGVAALAPATDLAALADAAQFTAVGKIMTSFVTAAYSEAYPDVRFDDYVRPRARARAIAGRCLSGAGVLASLLTTLSMETAFFAIPPVSGPLAQRFAQNTPTGSIAAPLLIAQGLADDLVLPAVQERFVKQRCDAGQPLEYRTYARRNHVGLVVSESPLTDDLLAWTRDRFAAAPVPDGCRTVAR